MCTELEVYLLFNAAVSSKSNPVEYLFEKLKRVFRGRTSKKKMENVGRTMHEECLKLTGRDAVHAFDSAMYWMKKAIAMKNFWIE